MAESPKILLIQLKRAGDVLVTTPIIEEVRRRFPDATIDFLVDRPFATLLTANPHLRNVLVFDATRNYRTWWEVRRERYTHIFDFQSSPRSALVCLTSGAHNTTGFAVRFWGHVYRRSYPRPVGAMRVERARWTLVEWFAGPLNDIPDRTLTLTPAEIAWGESIIPRHPGDVIGLIPTHRHSARKWPLEQFVALARLFLAEGSHVWIFWGPGEEAYVECLLRQAPGVQLIPKTTFREMGSLLKRCDVVVTNDNGPMHTAVSVGTPTVTIYGPTHPQNWNPGGPRHLALRDETLPCIACNLNVCPIQHPCMWNVTPDAVHRAAKNLIQRARDESGQPT